MLAFDFQPTLFARDPLMPALDALFGGPLVQLRPLGRCGVAPSLTASVTASVTESQDSYVVTVQAPGVKADDLSITFEHDILTVASSTESNSGVFSFKRQAKLPNADALTATATHEDGVLTVTLKKLPPPEPVSISVSDALAATDHEGDEAEESAKPYTLTIAAPGVKASDIHIEASQATLSINGETSSGAHGSFSVHRAYKLPRDADATIATATHIDGILSITLPTKLAEQATAIKISMEAEKAGSSDGETPEATPAEKPDAVPSSHVSLEVPKVKKEAAEEWLSEWDTVLDDLAEMGFEDRESSRAALAKHSGSIKRAVKELVASRAAL